MSRWEVLVANINPTLRPLDKVSLSYYIGEKVETSIRRNSTVGVAYSEWWLSHPSVIERLEPNNLKVTAYYLPDENGEPEDVFIFQGAPTSTRSARHRHSTASTPNRQMRTGQSSPNNAERGRNSRNTSLTTRPCASAL